MSEFRVSHSKLTQHFHRNSRSSIASAVGDSMTDDTILLYGKSVDSGLHKRGYTINITHSLHIAGSDPKHPTHILVGNHQVCFYLTQSSNLYLSNIVFDLTPQSRGIVADAHYTGNLILKNVVIIHDGGKLNNPRDYWPSITMTYQMQALNCGFQAEGCYFDDLCIMPVRQAAVNNCTIGRLDAPASMVGSSGLSVNNSLVTDTMLLNYNSQPRGAVTLHNLSTKGCLQFTGNMTVDGLTILNGIQKASHPFGFSGFGTKPQEILREYKTPMPIPMVKVVTFQGTENQVNFRNVKFDQSFKQLYGGNAISALYWFYFYGSSVNLKDFTIPKIPMGAKNITVKGSLVLDHVVDHSLWQLKGTDATNRFSRSDLFSHIDLSGVGSHHDTHSALSELNQMIGLKTVKEKVRQMINTAIANRIRQESGASSGKTTMHMVLTGNPGTGKTTVARLIGRALHENHVLSGTAFNEVHKNDLVSNHVGETPMKTRNQIEKAMGGVLFIDEAYDLIPPSNGSNSFNSEAIDTLITAMENHRKNLVVIFAGYTNEMKEFLHRANKGLASRVAYIINFPNYSNYDMDRILQLMINKLHLQFDDPQSTGTAMAQYLNDINDRLGANSSNGRTVRNYLDAVRNHLSNRVVSNAMKHHIDLRQHPEELSVITKSDARNGYFDQLKKIKAYRY